MNWVNQMLDRDLLFIALPFVAFVTLFNYVPILGWAIAFVRYIPGLPFFENRFVGFKYFRYLFSFASDFPRVMINTFAMSFLSIECELAVGCNREDLDPREPGGLDVADRLDGARGDRLRRVAL